MVEEGYARMSMCVADLWMNLGERPSPFYGAQAITWTPCSRLWQIMARHPYPLRNMRPKLRLPKVFCLRHWPRLRVFEQKFIGQIPPPDYAGKEAPKRRKLRRRRPIRN